jgi:MFS family permease
MNLKDTYTKILYAAYFFFSWAIGFTAYSNSKVIESINGRESIGVIYGLAAAITLILSTWVIPNIIKLLGNRRTIGLAIILEILSILGISYIDTPWLFGFSFILFLSTQVLISFNFDIFFEHNTKRENSAEARGLVVALQHVGRMLGPIMAAFLTVQIGLKAPYSVSLILMTSCGILLYFATLNFKDKAYVPVSVFKSIKTIKERPAVRKSLLSILLLHIFYALMVTFVPIYLGDVKGLNPESLGLLFTIMLTPFVVLGYPIGKHIDSGASGRIMARYGLFILAITTFIFPFIETSSLIIWGSILLLSRVGAVILETAGEGIFFKAIKEEESELLGVMRDMQPIGYFIASLVSVITLMFGSVKDIFYIVGIILVLGIISTNKKKVYANK